MPRFFLFTFILLLCLKAYAQQNFFNVPSSDITEKNKTFGQQQFNFFQSGLSSNTTCCFGLRNHTEIGINILGVTYDFSQNSFVQSRGDEKPIFPSFGLNAQKRLFKLGKYSLTLGGQTLFHSLQKEVEWYSYLNNKLETKSLKCILGLYAGNPNYFGSRPLFTNSNSKIGVQAGIDYAVSGDKWHIQADFLTGKTPMSNFIIGGAYFLNKQWVISAGYQVSYNNNRASNGAVVELTFIQ